MQRGRLAGCIVDRTPQGEGLRVIFESLLLLPQTAVCEAEGAEPARFGSTVLGFARERQRLVQGLKRIVILLEFRVFESQGQQGIRNARGISERLTNRQRVFVVLQ